VDSQGTKAAEASQPVGKDSKNEVIGKASDGDVPVLVHPGFHKTATTWLQRAIFSRTEAGYCMPSTSEATRMFILTNPYRFDPAQTRQECAPQLEQARAEGLVAVISCEDFSGYPWGSRFEGKGATERVLASFPEARVLITIREQKKTLLSLYRHYARSLDGSNEPLEKYIGIGNVAPGFSPTFRLDQLEYDLFIRFCQERVGAERVLVLPMEMLAADPAEYWRRLTEFSGATPALSSDDFVKLSKEKEREGFNAFTGEIARFLKPYFRMNTLGPDHPLPTRLKEKLLRRIDPLIPASLARRVAKKQTDVLQGHVGDYYRASNRRTTKLTGLDLAGWGYDC